jgi:heme oxygenase
VGNTLELFVAHVVKSYEEIEKFNKEITRFLEGKVEKSPLNRLELII